MEHKSLLMMCFLIISFAATFHLSVPWPILIGNIVARTLGLYLMLNLMMFTAPKIFQDPHSENRKRSIAKRIGFGFLQIPLIVLSILSVI